MSVVESHKNYEPRLVFFYFVIGAMMVILFGGLAWRQLVNRGTYSDRERLQNTRRIISPAPRGNIYDREGRLLVGNRPRFAVVLDLEGLRPDFRSQYIRVVRNYREMDDSVRPRAGALEKIARAGVVQSHLDLINGILDRTERIDADELERHFNRRRLLPYVLIEDLPPVDFARLIEQVPPESPLQLVTSSVRYYPHYGTAAHSLGYVVADMDLPSDDLPGEDLTTLALRGSKGRNGLELFFDDVLQGRTGGTIFRVDPAGFRVNPPLERHLPIPGEDLSISLDIDLQASAESAMEGRRGAAVAMDVATGEVLVMASLPAYDLNEFSPSLSHAEAARINDEGAWLNRAAQGLYPPGSTYKLVTAVAGLRHGWIDTETPVFCEGYHQVAGRRFPCHNRSGHGEMDLRNAIRASCNVYFYKLGVETGVADIAAESRAFGFDEPTGVELPYEATRMLVPDAEWKRASQGMPWFPGDTANLSIGQGFLRVTPLQMAAFTASLARGETRTRPTLVHRRNAPRQRSEPIGLPPEVFDAIIEGMEMSATIGTGRLAAVRGVRLAVKTGTAQVQRQEGTLQLAWMVGFAPVERPTIAVAVVLEGTEPDESYAGGRMAAPVAQAIFQTYFSKRGRLGEPDLARADLRE